MKYEVTSPFIESEKVYIEQDLFLVICPSAKGTAIKKNKVYTSRKAAEDSIKAVPTNNIGDPWIVVEITQLKL